MRAQSSERGRVRRQPRQQTSWLPGSTATFPARPAAATAVQKRSQAAASPVSVTSPVTSTRSASLQRRVGQQAVEVAVHAAQPAEEARLGAGRAVVGGQVQVRHMGQGDPLRHGRPRLFFLLYMGHLFEGNRFNRTSNIEH